MQAERAREMNTKSVTFDLLCNVIDLYLGWQKQRNNQPFELCNQMQPLTGTSTETTSQAPLTVPGTGSVNLDRETKAGHSPGLTKCADPHSTTIIQ